MKIKIQKYEYIRQNIEIEVEVPEIIRYYWHNGIRKAYAVIPEWTTWNKEHYQKEEEIYAFNIITVDPTLNQISITTINISSFPDILKDSNNNYNRIIDNILNFPEKETRTKEKFMADYNGVLEKMSKILTK